LVAPYIGRISLLVIGILLALLPPASRPVSSALAQSCTFVLGFKTFHDLLPAIVGTCEDDEQHSPTNGDGLQRTTNGLLVWRKADNVTAFTDGYRTWLEGPQGLEKRLNGQRFPWESNPAELPVVADALVGTAQTVDPAFAPLARDLPSHTRVPVWLPTHAPRSPEFGLRCPPNYALLTRQPRLPTPANGYLIAMYCSSKPVPPDDPSLYVPGSSPAESANLGYLSGSPVMPQLQFVDRQHRAALSVVQLPSGLTIRRVTDPNGGESATWASGAWQYAVIGGIAPARSSSASQRQVDALLLQHATQLAALVQASPPVVGAVHGWVSLSYGTHDYLTVTWQTAPGFFYQAQWKDNPAAGIAMARTLVPLAIP
jgi:hypothetical protein